MTDITKEMYLLALNIVNLYETSQKQQQTDNIPKNPIVLKDDVIVFTKIGHLNNTLKIGKRYKVISSHISPNNYSDLDDFFDRNSDTPIRRLNKMTYDFLKDNNIKCHVSSLTLDLGNGTRYNLHLTSHYEYHLAHLALT
jgi:hypothetical protein